MSLELPDIDRVDADLRALGLATTAAELHGGLCGWLAGNGDGGAGWLGRVMADDALPEAPAALQALRDATAAQLDDRSFEFELLLPDAGASLAERSGALFDWCRGFVGAFGLAAGARSLDALSEEGREGLADLARLAAAEAQDEGDEEDEEDEEAFVELEEFVRVVALLLHGDCVLGPRHRARFN